MPQKTFGLATLVLLLIFGCGTKDGAPLPATEGLLKGVDTSLPKEAQARQQVIRNVLVNLQEGYAVDRLKTFLPGVKFNESEAQFLDGARYLESWSFNGRPLGDEVPVTLSFATESSAGGSPKSVDRVYLVKGSAGRYSVSRK